MQNALYFYFKIGLIILIVATLFCSKRPTEVNSKDIAKPQILYVSNLEIPINENMAKIYKALTIIDANGKNRRDVFTVNRGFLYDPIFTPDGNKILFAMYSDTTKEYALYTIGSNGNDLIKISNNISSSSFIPFNNPQFFPNGINIVYIIRMDTKNCEIRILNSQSKEDKLLTNGYFYGLYPEISGDGEWIIFWENGDLYKIHKTGGEKYKITNGNAYAERFDLNKQTNEIVFRSYNSENPGEMNIAKINLDGTGFVKYNFSGQYPKISPDGNHIIFLAMGNSSPSIWMANTDGSNPHIVTSYYTWDDFVQFYPSGEKLLFVREVRERAIFSCDLNGNNIQQLSEFDYYQGRPVFKP